MGVNTSVLTTGSALNVNGNIRVRSSNGTSIGNVFLHNTNSDNYALKTTYGFSIHGPGSADNGAVSFYSGSTQRLGFIDKTAMSCDVYTQQTSNGPVTLRSANQTGGVSGHTIITTGKSATSSVSAGNVYIYPGAPNNSAEGTSPFAGNPGSIFVQVYVDTNALVNHRLATALYVPFVPEGGEVSISLCGSHTPTSNVDIDGKARIRVLPDSLFQYEVRADANGRLSRQVGSFVGTISASTDASGDIVVAHGMGTTPTSVQVTVTGTTPYVVTVHTIGGTNFTVRFFDTSGAAVASTAVTATWHCKT
jgi:hypothetical protein